MLPRTFVRRQRTVKPTAPEYLKALSSYNSNGCIVFTGGTNQDGYGRVSGMRWGKKYKVASAHQLAYILANGEYDRTLNVCHSCDNPSCINPKHLWLGTQADNMQDKKRKGRAIKPGMAGEGNIKAKLTDKNVKFIRENRSIHCKVICEMFDISDSSVYAIRLNQTWRHLL